MHIPHKIITIDFGNSHPHFAVFSNKKQIKSVAPIDDLITNHVSDYNCIGAYSQVAPITQKIQEALNKFQSLLNFNDYKKKYLGKIPLNYSESLGSDRLIQSIFLYKQYLSPYQKQDHKKLQKFLIVDIGSYITFDFISEKGISGGPIFPGPEFYLNTYLKSNALNPIATQIITESLQPFHEKYENIKNTKTALMAGLSYYLESLFYKIDHSYPNIDHIFITGGQAQIAYSLLEKSSLQFSFTKYDHLIHHALFDFYTDIQLQNGGSFI